MSIELKIKSKHLALEPAIIRKEEGKLKKQLNWYKKTYQVTDIYSHKEAYATYNKWFSLQNHRKTVVRNEARATHLVRAYLAGIPYEKVEAKMHDETLFHTVILPRVYSMVAKYGPKPLHKKYNRDQSKFVYDESEYKVLTDAVKAWCHVS